ncbi:hypothetical protein Tco_1483354 [Tanacetum coccineum]
MRGRRRTKTARYHCKVRADFAPGCSSPFLTVSLMQVLTVIDEDGHGGRTFSSCQEVKDDYGPLVGLPWLGKSRSAVKRLLPGSIERQSVRVSAPIHATVVTATHSDLAGTDLVHRVASLVCFCSGFLVGGIRTVVDPEFDLQNVYVPHIECYKCVMLALEEEKGVLDVKVADLLLRLKSESKCLLIRTALVTITVNCRMKVMPIRLPDFTVRSLPLTICLNSTDNLSALGATFVRLCEKGMQEGNIRRITPGIKGRTLTDISYRFEDHLLIVGSTASQPHLTSLMVPDSTFSDHREIEASCFLCVDDDDTDDDDDYDDYFYDYVDFEEDGGKIDLDISKIVNISLREKLVESYLLIEKRGDMLSFLDDSMIFSEYEFITFDDEHVMAEVNVFDEINTSELSYPGIGENVAFDEEEDTFTFTTRSFLPFVTYPEVLPISYSTGSEDKVFKPGIFDNVLKRKSSLTLDVFDPLHPPLMDFLLPKAFSEFIFSLVKIFSKKFVEHGIKNATKDQEEKSTGELLAEERLQKDNQALNEIQSSQEMRIQDLEIQKQQCLEEMKEWMNDLGIREYQKEEINIDYRRKYLVDISLREKLVESYLLIEKVNAFSLSPPIPISPIICPSSTIPVVDLDLPLEEADVLSFSDDSMIFSEYESFTFEDEPVMAEVNVFDEINTSELSYPGIGENVVFDEEEDTFTFTTRSFLPFVTYPEVLPVSYSTGSEDKIFKPGIFDNGAFKDKSSKELAPSKALLTRDVFDPPHPPLMDFHVTKAFSGFTFSLLKIFSKKFVEPGIKNATLCVDDDDTDDDDDYDDYFYDYVDFEEDGGKIDLDISKIVNISLREKLVESYLLIEKVNAFSLSPPIPISPILGPSSTIPVVDIDLPLEEADVLSFSDDSMIFSEYESFTFDDEPVMAEVNVFDEINTSELSYPGIGENVVFDEEEDTFTFTTRSFLPFVTYPEVLPTSYSTGSEDKVFNRGIFDNVLMRKSSLTLDVFDPLHPPLMDFHDTKAFSEFIFSLVKIFSKKFVEHGIKNATVYLSTLVWGGFHLLEFLHPHYYPP